MNDEKEEFPSVGEQAQQLGQFMAQSWQQMLDGGELMVDKYEQQRRFDICQVCEHFSKHNKRCRKCGCFLTYKIKFEVSECPIKKW